MKKLQSVKILDAKVLNCTIDELMQYTDEAIQNRELVKGTGINLNQLYLIKNDNRFAKSIKNCVVLVPDGAPIMWIAKWVGSPLKSKIPGPEYTYELFRLAAEKGYSVFILGGKPGSAELAIENMKKDFPSLPDVQFYCPPFGFEKDEAETKKIVKLLKDSKADILVMALGAPKQENFADEYHEEIQIPIIFGSGIAVDYFAGRVKKAPAWINKIGLEWLYRFFQEPKRLFERYIIHDLPLLFKLRRWAKRESKKRIQEIK